MTPPLVIIAAVARNGVIGGDNRLLWRLPSDLRRFRELTWGKPLIMGRKTFAAIGRPLPGRATIVVTREAGYVGPAEVGIARSLDEAVLMASERATTLKASEIMVAGGGEIYAGMMDRATQLEITEVDVAPAGDACFPAIDPAAWRETSRLAPPRGAHDEADFAFVSYIRRADSST